MGQRYFVSRKQVTPTAGNDLITIIPASNRRTRLLEVSVAGNGTTAAFQQVDVGVSSGGTTGGGGLTPEKYSHQQQPSAASTVNTTWSVQPTLGTHNIVLGFSALGGANRWVPPGGSGIEVTGNAAYISIRANANMTSQSMSINVVFEED
jgi:hypothetical protein